MPDLMGPIGVALVGVIGIIVGGLLRLIPTKGSVENARIDQLQEDLAAERQERKELSGRVDLMDRKLDHYRRRDLAWMRHYALIQRGVEDGTIPPWPDLPEVLRGDYE
ncbi:hypothetical protein [Microbacterium sp. Leaf320]|uniref:hypothetical protein n=1 Tax=Microbacterium sp. Leaf320 TaxID=1736334 RepID=UPI000A745B57|nr:hypothetical protein [Microbacterium sp. Leaf320]